jgi:putative hemolysin
MHTKIIDVKASIKKSNSKLLKGLPNFVINILAKIVKQDELNNLINAHSDVEGKDFCPKVLEYLNINVNLNGFDNMPENSKVFVVANHPFGVADGLILLSLVAKKYNKLKAIGNELFILIPQIRSVIAAVNVFGRNSKDYIKELDKVYNSDEPIAHFPAGLVSRIIDNKVKDSDWQKSVVTKAIQCERDIVPMYFKGKNSRLFYAIYRVRKFFKININIELMLLPRELFNKQNKTIDVIIGKPISYKTFDKSKTHFEWAQWLKNELYKLDK